jgi:hypothetical protein
VEDEGPQKSGSEYEPQANEGYEEEEVSKVQFLLSTLQCLCNEYYLQLC